MHIAVISDLHDNVANWQLINAFLAEEQIMMLINCGDTAAPAMLQEIAKTFSGEIHTVFGNVADRELEATVAKSLPNVHHYGDHGEFLVAGKKLGINHFPDVAERDAKSGKYDLVCFGHTHLKRWEKIGETLLLNPGTAAGMFQYPSFAVIDVVNMTCNFEDIRL